MKCWNCGTQNQKTAKKCKKCGSDLTKPEDEKETIVEQDESKNSEKKINPLIWAAVGVAGVALIVALVFVFSNRSSNSDDTGILDDNTGVQQEATIAALAEQALAEESETQEQPAEGSIEIEPTSELQLAATEESKEILGEGCDWSTCAWMGADQCVECGGKWQVYSDESYCDCSDSKWNSQELEWCKFESGTWLQDEERCSFLDTAASAAASVSSDTSTVESACSDLFYQMSDGNDADYQAFRADCKKVGGVDQCWDDACNLMVCMCPDEKSVSKSCDWVEGQAVDTNIRCYDENGTCWITMQPSDAILNLDEEDTAPEVIVTTREGTTYSSIDLDRNSSGCIYNDDQISCLLTEDGTFNTTTVEDVYICKDLCCMNVDNLEEGNVVIQSGDCPASGNLEVKGFQLINGILTFELHNDLGWQVSVMDIFLDDAKGDQWTTMNCEIDDKYDTIMNCEGWAVYKSGYATISFYYGTGSEACSIDNFKYTLPNINPCTNGHWCSYSGKCCGNGYSCCSCGCIKLGSNESCSEACN